jgi:hypothetical protein
VGRLRRRQNQKVLLRAFQHVSGGVAEQERAVAKTVTSVSCPTHVSCHAFAVLSQELEQNPIWGHSRLRQEDATSALLMLTRWLFSAVETLVTGVRDNSCEVAALMLPMRLILEPDVTIDDLDPDEIYNVVRQALGDVRAGPDGGGGFFLLEGQLRGRGLLDVEMQMLEQYGGRFPDAIDGWTCQIHPPIPPGSQRNTRPASPERDKWSLSQIDIPSVPPDDPMFSSEVLIVTPVKFKPQQNHGSPRSEERESD